jgi:hypothetical protein
MAAERVGRLCLSLVRDRFLRVVLTEAGVTTAQWESLAEAVRSGAGPETLAPLLDALEETAAAAGVDGITTGGRSFQPLPDAAVGFRTVRGWRCPHPHPCDRVQLSRDRAALLCPLTADPLTPVRVVSG